jgi:sugar lactone lactonase YvrE
LSSVPSKSAAPSIVSTVQLNNTCNVISTVAGNGQCGYTGDNGNAKVASLSSPIGITVDSLTNLYIADFDNNVIRKVTKLTGIVTTIAGDGNCQSDGSGYSGPALSISFNQIWDVSLDTSANVYVSDSDDNVIRKLTVLTGIIATFVGNGQSSYNGENLLATSASLSGPRGIFLDSSSNLYVADTNNHRIRKIDVITKVITTIVGNGQSGYTGDNGVGTNAKLNKPNSVFVDTSGNVFIADYNNYCIRKLTKATSIIATIVGSGSYGYSGDNGLATNAKMRQPFDMLVDSIGNILVSDGNNNVIRKVSISTNIITTIVGTGLATFDGDDASATSKSLYKQACIALDNSGNLYIADKYNNRIRKM